MSNDDSTMQTPNEQMDEINLILDLYRRGIERHYGGRTIGKTLTGEEAAARLQRLVLEGQRELLLEQEKAAYEGGYMWTDGGECVEFVNDRIAALNRQIEGLEKS